ncbi:uncharacterized protein [Palaemon carinicauda]|uniref:uncharacterized protein n=1 Tax=Palaemon carinicauda TaxID=392227 RepID=UPI0035B58620
MNMIFGPRPTLGWLGYLMIGDSWRRLTILLVVVGFVTLFIVDEGQKMVTLRHISPAPFPPPITFVHNPDNSYLTPLDACSVEAASVDTKKTRRIYVYLWKETVTPADEWANWILRLPMIQVTYMDLAKLIGGSQLSSLRKAAFKGTWQKWLAARLAILWNFGGISMPFGTIMTKPLSVDVMGSHNGIIVEGETGYLDPIVLGTPSHHLVIATLAKYLVNGTNDASEETVTNPEGLLTKAILNGCGLDQLSHMAFSDCDSFNFITKNQISYLRDQQMIEDPHPESALLIRYPEELYTFRDDKIFWRYFQTNRLERFCPVTARHLQLRVVANDI